MTEPLTTPVRSAGHVCCDCVADASEQIQSLTRLLEDALVGYYSFHNLHHGGAFITCGRFPCNQDFLGRGEL